VAAWCCCQYSLTLLSVAACWCCWHWLLVGVGVGVIVVVIVNGGCLNWLNVGLVSGKSLLLALVVAYAMSKSSFKKNLIT